MITAGDVADSLSLGQQLIYHAQRNIVPVGNVLPGSSSGIAGARILSRKSNDSVFMLESQHEVC